MTQTICGLLLVVATFGGCSGGKGNSYSPAAPTPTPSSSPAPTPTPGAAVADVVISIVGMNGDLSYSPNPAAIMVGQTVAWKNVDSVPHTASANAGGFDTGTLAAGVTSRAITMTAAGTFGYHCAIHGSMTGTLTVTVAPY
jgi:plastocyanin